MLTQLTAAGALLGAALFASPSLAQTSLDQNLPEYEKASGISGDLKSVGSDTLNNLMGLWSESFEELYPQVSIEVEGKGSSTAPPALIEGTSQLGPMSRAMKGEEEAAFKKAFGYAPTPIRVAVDALGVFVHKDNPVQELSLDQLEQIFSVNGANMTWGDVGVQGDWANKPISLYGRNSASGTYAYFKEVALGKSDFKPTVKEQPGSSGVVSGIAGDRFGIGYSGIGYKTADVKVVPISDGGEAFEATAENAYAGDYPLARFLYVYVNVPPNSQPSPIVKEFLAMVLSKRGQELVAKEGYYPLTGRIAQEDRAKLGIQD